MRQVLHLLFLITYLITACLLAVPSIAQQSYSISYAGSVDYYYNDEIEVILDDNELSAALPIGFDFEFFGNTYTEFYISSNGYITFDPAAGHGCCTGQLIPDSNPPNNLIAAAWEDLNPDGDGWYSYEIAGSAPDRILVVTFWTPNAFNVRLDAQIWLYEGSNIIEIHTWYYDVADQATQGIENAGGTEAYYHPERNSTWFEIWNDYIAFIPLQDNDAGILANITTYCEGTQDIKTILHNFGGNVITSVDVHWQWNTAPQTPVAWTGTLQPGESTIVTLGQQMLTFGDQDTLYAWTSFPNGMPDPNPDNDLKVSFITPGVEGTFTIGGTDPDYATIQEAIDDLELHGICQTVTLDIRPGTYDEQILIGYIPGANDDREVILRSETGDASDVTITYAPSSFNQNYVIRLDNSQNIVLEHLTLAAAGTFNSTYVVDLRNYAVDNTIRYCTLSANTASGGIGIYSEAYIARNTYTHNVFQDHNYGIYHWYTESPDGIEIAYNVFINNRHAVELSFTHGISIHHNVITSSQSNASGLVLFEDVADFHIFNNQVILENGNTGIRAGWCNYPASAGWIYNNMISMAGTATNPIGLIVNSSNNTSIYFNSVQLTNTSATGRTMELSSGDGNVSMNNILSNTGGGYAIQASNLNTNISDNNNLYATGTFLARFGTTSLSGLNDWIFVTGRDENSLNVPPMFISDTDLHTIQSLFNKAAVPIAMITTDFDDEPRDPLYPDIGADEFVPLPDDIGVSAFASPGDTCVTDQPVIVVVRNYGSNQVTEYTVEWELDGIPQTPLMITETLDTIGGVGNDTAHHVLGALMFDDEVISLKAWTSMPNGVADAIPDNDTTSILYRLPLAGDFTVGGVDPDFETLADAADMLEAFGVCGPVSLQIRDGTYNWQASFGFISGTSETNRVTITSESGDSSAVLIQFASAGAYVLQFDKTDFVTVSHLSFKTLSTSNGRILSMLNGADHIIIEHCGFTGSTSTFNTTNSENILSSGENTGLTVRNCTFRLGSEAIRLAGPSTSSRVSDIVIEDNVFLDHFSEAIEINNGANVTIRRNTIDKHAANTTFSGIAMSNVQMGLEIYLNKINISTTGRGMSLSSINSNDQSVFARIYNNFVRVSSTGNWQGISISSSNYAGVYFNNVNNQSTHSSAPAFSLGFGNMVDVKNNCFVAFNGPAFHFSGTFANHTSDYNNLYSHNGNISNFIAGATLEDWQDLSGWDANSISVNPNYYSDSDLHVFNAALDGAATPIAGIATDIDGEMRDPDFPDIGADEIGTGVDDVGPVAILPQRPFASGVQDVYVVVRNYGGNTVTSLDIYWEVQEISQSPFAYSGSMMPLTADTIFIGQYDFVVGTAYDIRAWTSMPNGVADNVPANDTTAVSDLYAAISGDVTIGGSDPDFETISDAVETMLFGGVLDSVIFKMRNGTYTEIITLPHDDEFACGRTIVFESESGDPEDVIWSNQSLSGPPLTLNGADGLTFRNITFQATSATHGRTVQVQNQSHCNTFDGCRFVGINTTSTSINLALVFSSTDRDTANVFINSTFIDGSYGIYWFGTSAQKETGTRVEGNQFIDQYWRGMETGHQDGVVIKNNLIETISTPHSGFMGISVNSSPNQNIIAANDLRLRLGRGIHVNGCAGTATAPGLIYNNFVQLGEAAQAFGIHVTLSPYQRIYHNTVRMNGANANIWALYHQSGSNLHIVNNILDNRAGSAAIRSAAVADIVNSDHNNLLTTGTTLVHTNIATYEDLEAWQGTGFDLNSLSVDPEYVSETDLHVTSAQLKGAGTPIPEVTVDIDGDPRDPVAPDIGADEFSLFSDDVGVLAINYPVQPFPSGVNSVFIRFVNNGEDTLVTMQVDWEVNGMSQPTYYWTGLLPSGAVYDSLEIGQYDFAPYMAHSIKVWVSEPNGMPDGLASNDTLFVTELYPALFGIYTIGGTDPDFETFNEALTHLNAGGASAPVTFNIRDGVYLETMMIGAYPGSDCDRPVIFQSESRDSSKVRISNLGVDAHILVIEGADGLVFRDLTMEAVNPSFRRVIQFSGGAHCNTFEHNHLIGYESTSTSNAHAVVYSNVDHDRDNVFRRNLIEHGAYGFYLVGTNNATAGTIIEDNVINSYFTGIQAIREDGIRIARNQVQVNSGSGSVGIYLLECDDNVLVERNHIYNPSGIYGIRISTCVATEMTRSRIVNNFIITGGSGSNYAISLESSSRFDIYHNNISANSTSTNISGNAGLRMTSSTLLNVLNNISYHSGPGVAILSSSSSFLSMDHNDWVSDGDYLGRWNGDDAEDLDAWQTLSGLDANSLSANPQYMSLTDLHVSLVLLNGAALPLADVTEDYDGEPRDPDAPDIGADEFTPAIDDDTGIFALNAPLIPFASGPQDVEVTLKNFGANNLNSATVRWLVNGIEQVPFDWTGDLLPGGCDTITVGSYDFAEYTAHQLFFWTEFPNGVPDSVPVNDTLVINQHYPALQGSYTVGGLLPDFNLFSQLQTALNTGGTLGDVIFDIRPGTYDIQLLIQDFPRASQTDSVTFRSETGNANDVQIRRTFTSSQNYTIRINKAHHIALRNVTLESTRGRILDITGGAHDILVEGCVFNGVQGLNGDTYSCIFSGTTTENRVRILNNIFNHGSYGVRLTASSGAREHGTVIIGNAFYDQRQRAMSLTYQNAVEVTGNLVRNSQHSIYGIELVVCDSTLTIAQNDIRISAGGTGIYLFACDAYAARGQIVNNHLGVGGPGSTWGIYTSQIKQMDIHYNTVRIEHATGQNRAYEDVSSSSGNNDVRNCVFANLSGGYSIRVSWSGSTMDYCNLFTTGPALAHWTIERVDLAALQAGSGQHANSISIDPIFMEPDGYRVGQVAMDGAAQPVSTITDIEGAARDAMMPDMGAWEFTPLLDDLAVVGLVSPATFCGLSDAEEVTIRVQNRGSNVQSGFDVAYAFQGQGWVAENVGALTVHPGQIADFTFTGTLDLSAIGNYTFHLHVVLDGDEDTSNDTLMNINVEHIPELTQPVSNMIPADGAMGLEKTVSLSWAPAPNATKYDIYIWPDGSAQPGIPQVANLAQINTLYSNLNYGVTYLWQVIAKNVCDQMTAGPVQEFSVRQLPDLIIDQVTAPSSAFSGQQIQIDWQVKNIGQGSTQSQLWTDAIFLSADATLNVSLDTYLGGVQNLTALESDGAYSNSATFTVPQGFVGDYYVFVYTDRFNNLIETNNNNNWDRTSTPVMINLSPSPDLVVDDIVIPSSAFSGQEVPVMFTIRNNGSGAATAMEWRDVVSLVPGNTILKNIKRTAPLQPDSVYTVMTEVTLPQGIFGDYFIEVYTDYYNQVYEFGAENNNTLLSDALNVFLTPPPDLVPVAINIPDTVSSNELLSITWLVENQGATSPTASFWTDRLVISPSPVFNPNFNTTLNTKSKSSPLDPMEQYTLGNAVRIPAAIHGDRYLYVTTDINNTVFEYEFEDNNTYRTPGTIYVASPDLEAYNIVTPSSATSGTSVPISYQMINSGLGDLVQRVFVDRIYLSTDQTLDGGDILLMSITRSGVQGTLNRSDTTTRNQTLNLPAGVHGEYYVIVHVDANNQIYELGSESNNIVSSGMPININLAPWPDLLPQAITVADTLIAGQSFELSYEILNQGTGNAPGFGKEGVYYSFSPVWDAALATKLITINRPGTLQKDSSIAVALQFTLPQNIVSNVYYFYIWSDEENIIFENNNDANNIQRSDPVFVKAFPDVDLVLDTLYINVDTLHSGAPFTLNYRILNDGEGPPLVSQWQDRAYLSVDPELDYILDISLGLRLTNPGTFPPQTTTLQQHTFIVPNGIEGDYYLFLDVDHYDENMDIDRTNNIDLLRDANSAPRQIYVKLSPSPDLRVALFDAPSIAIAGQPVHIDWSIVNAGTGSASTWVDRIYLSTDPVIGQGDILLLEKRFHHLQAGDSTLDNTIIYLPASLQGNYYLILQTDARNEIYEHLGEHNNLAIRTIQIDQPPPSDLIVASVNVPAHVIAGEDINISWHTENQGAFTASGQMREIVYLSSDPYLDVDDVIFAIKDGPLFLPPAGTRADSAIAPVLDLAIGDYYALVQTDARNSIYESNDTNNITASLDVMQVDVNELYLNYLTPDTLINGRALYYKIVIPAVTEGSSLSVELFGDTLVSANELYIRYGNMPTRAVYDAGFDRPNESYQRVIITDLQPGTYYILAYGRHDTLSHQPIELFADVINYALISVAPNRGSNEGWATLSLKGANLDSTLIVRLTDTLFNYFEADTFTIVNEQLIVARFDLRNVPAGVYTIETTKEPDLLATLPDAFTVLEDGGPDLQITYRFTPESFFQNTSVSKLVVEAINNGTNDAENLSFVLESVAGDQLAKTLEDHFQNNVSKTVTEPIGQSQGFSNILAPGEAFRLEYIIRVQPYPVVSITVVSND